MLDKLVMLACLLIAWWAIDRMPVQRANAFAVLPPEPKRPSVPRRKPVTESAIMPNMETWNGISPYDPTRLENPTYAVRNYEKANPDVYIDEWKIVSGQTGR